MIVFVSFVLFYFVCGFVCGVVGVCVGVGCVMCGCVCGMGCVLAVQHLLGYALHKYLYVCM